MNDNHPRFFFQRFSHHSCLFFTNLPVSPPFPSPQGLLQGQGKLVWKMRLMPSSLASKSHRRLTQLVDSKHKKVYKVKTVATTVDPEKEKEAREKVSGGRFWGAEDKAWAVQ
jgi:hypothetical protein